jgi:hypothetical protein
LRRRLEPGGATIETMATRCDCRWENVELHPELAPLLLRAGDEPGCPAHSSVREGEDTAV